MVLANTQSATKGDDPTAQTSSLDLDRRVLKELDDPRHALEFWRSTPPLPVGHRVRANAELLGHFLLKEAKVKPLLAEVVAEGPQLPWMGSWERP